MFYSQRNTYSSDNFFTWAWLSVARFWVCTNSIASLSAILWLTFHGSGLRNLRSTTTGFRAFCSWFWLPWIPCTVYCNCIYNQLMVIQYRNKRIIILIDKQQNYRQKFRNIPIHSFLHLSWSCLLQPFVWTFVVPAFIFSQLSLALGHCLHFFAVLQKLNPSHWVKSVHSNIFTKR